MEYLIIINIIATVVAVLVFNNAYKKHDRDIKRIESLAIDRLNILTRLSQKHDKAEAKIINRINETKGMIKAEGIDTYRQIVAAQRIDALIGPGYSLGLRGWPISPDALLEILSYIKTHKPKLILELGSGRGTLAIDSLIKKYNLDTKLISVDHLQKYLNETKERLGESNDVELILAPLKIQKVLGLGNAVKWYDIEAITTSIKGRKIDLMIVDGPPESIAKNSRLPALRALSPYLIEDASIFLDDYSRDSEHEAIKDWMNFDKTTNPQVLSIETEKGLALYKRKNK